MEWPDIHCCICEQILKAPGAILLSPPISRNQVVKLHVCASCWYSDDFCTLRGEGA